MIAGSALISTSARNASAFASRLGAPRSGRRLAGVLCFDLRGSESLMVPIAPSSCSRALESECEEYLPYVDCSMVSQRVESVTGQWRGEARGYVSVSYRGCGFERVGCSRAPRWRVQQNSGHA